jgi:hypothetical protein
MPSLSQLTTLAVLVLCVLQLGARTAFAAPMDPPHEEQAMSSSMILLFLNGAITVD